MKLIFLDIDGVLVCPEQCMLPMLKVAGENMHRFNPEAVAAINQVTDTTGAEFVLSSSWRVLHSFDALNKHFKNQGVKAGLLDKTPRLDSHERGLEILEWLNIHREIDVESFIILDDERDAAHTPELKERFIQTLWRDWDNKGLPLGFTMEHAKRAIQLLGVKNVSRN